MESRKTTGNHKNTKEDEKEVVIKKATNLGKHEDHHVYD